jgi:predicted nucleic acid-binding Zn ribbon protein
MTYDYKCRECSTIWPVSHKMDVKNPIEELGIECPECNSANIFRYLGNYGTATIVFKGTGWAHKDIMLDKIGMPKTTQNSPEAQAALKKRL